MNITHTEKLSTSESLALLRGAPIGRLAVVIGERPDIFPVNHVIDHGAVVFRTGSGSKLAAAIGQHVAYEADGYDASNAQAWSVVVAGRAIEILQLHDVLEALGLPLFPWEAGAKPHVVRIEPDDITGRRFAVHGGTRLALGGPLPADSRVQPPRIRTS
ncbi:pyridoxamine 5'-phosphate oxidase family protein [Luteipulveratus mongoliensis]|nr:pyridoxamine 5'-phosphate oxidase family protein [Luteipulveratus mongoliensis]